MLKLTQKELDSLQKLYLSARDHLLNTIVNYKGVGTKVYANSILQDLNRHIKGLQTASNHFIETAIPAEYEDGLKKVYDYFKKNNLLMSRPDIFANIHTDAIHSLAREMQVQIQDGLGQVGRQILRYTDSARDEALRAVGLTASGEKAAAGETVKQMRDNMVKKLQSEGFMTVQYGSGNRAYQVPLDTYAMLCARSTTREAGNLSRENQLQENGYDLMEMTEHYPTCDICAPLQGRVYSISGKDKRFPPLSMAFSGGYHNVHPNCAHSLVPWIESLQTDEELQSAIERSNQPIEDTRDRKQMELYNRQQAKNRKLREDRYQYERYKARLGEDAPKTFSAFRRLKNADGEAWENAREQYRTSKNVVISEKTDIMKTGASGAIPITDLKRRDKHAYTYYEEIRKRKGDIEAISKNTGFTVGEIEKVKNHMFINAYDLGEDLPARFDPDYNIAMSWQRLIDGKNIREMDIVLLNHELMEQRLMSERGLSYREAHALAEKKHNYKKYVDEMERRFAK